MLDIIAPGWLHFYLRRECSFSRNASSYTVVGDVRYYTMYGHNFGLKAAVLSFNRHSQLLYGRRKPSSEFAMRLTSTTLIRRSPLTVAQRVRVCFTSWPDWLGRRSPLRRIRRLRRRGRRSSELCPTYPTFGRALWRCVPSRAEWLRLSIA